MLVVSCSSVGDSNSSSDTGAGGWGTAALRNSFLPGIAATRCLLASTRGLLARFLDTVLVAWLLVVKEVRIESCTSLP